MLQRNDGNDLNPRPTTSEEPEEEEERWGQVLAALSSAPTVRGLEGPRSSFVCCGIRVTLPYPKMYKSQRQMMSKVLEGVGKGDNCLLESPTGTGKTAALLCSLLAWQQDCVTTNKSVASFFKEKVKGLEGTGVGCSCGLIAYPDRLASRPIIKEEPKDSKRFFLTATFLPEKYEEEGQGQRTPAAPSSPSNANSTSTFTVSPLQRLKLASPKQILVSEMTTQPFGAEEATLPTPSLNLNIYSSFPPSTLLDPSCEDVKSKPQSSRSNPLSITKAKEKLCQFCVKSFLSKPSVPKIFYATRTHSQVGQVVAELKASPYKDTTMTILGSRKTSCIASNSAVQAARDAEKGQDQGETTVIIQPQQTATATGPQEDDLLDEGCRLLRKNYFWNLKNEGKKAKLPTCSYFLPRGELTKKLGTCGGCDSSSLTDSAWDIEDLKGFGRKANLCPYYTSQALLEEADIVFCPYNYIIYPEIRKALKIDLTGSVVVFDEAHNLEDICRDAASMKLNLHTLDRKRQDLDLLLAKAKGDSEKIAPAQSLSRLLQTVSTWMRKNAPSLPSRNIYAPSPRLSRKNHKAYSGQALSEILEALGLGREGLEQAWEQVTILTSESEGGGDSEGSNKKEFKIPGGITRTLTALLRSIRFLYEDDNIQHYQAVIVNQARRSPGRDEDEVVFQLMCLSPAVAFKPIRDNVHSVIVASGTLAPLDSFELELETPFRRKLSASHVIKDVQAMACCLQNDELGSAIDLTKPGQDDPASQDQIGELILRICHSVPHGVLVFVPSYSYMNALKARWSAPTNSSPCLLSRLQETKQAIFWEQTEKLAFETEMKAYHSLIKEGKSCLLFAVFRGKISEGLNFRDNQARAVLTLGIPFPSREAPEVRYKQEYNNIRLATTDGYLSGRQWYECQTFRAMNQAFGRCVRHEKDWGALILLESRFAQERYYAQLSQWVKTDLRQFQRVEDLTRELEDFVKKRKKAEKEEEGRQEA